jgi:hypothetical protein
VLNITYLFRSESKILNKFIKKESNLLTSHFKCRTRDLKQMLKTLSNLIEFASYVHFPIFLKRFYPSSSLSIYPLFASLIPNDKENPCKQTSLIFFILQKKKKKEKTLSTHIHSLIVLSLTIHKLILLLSWTKRSLYLHCFI